MEHTVMFELHC